MDDGDVAMDRISDLPEPLITQILSLMKTKEAVRTCMLSKRWTNLWTCMAILDFDYYINYREENLYCDYYPFDYISRYDSEDKFMKFVYGVLNRRGFSPLDKFKLSWQSTNRRNLAIVEEIINHVFACMPRVIYICTKSDSLFDLPNSFFNCGSVKEMSLFSMFGKQITWEHQPKSINFPSLQKLELGYTFIKDGFIRMLLLGCPILEELILTSCCLMINGINSNVLKKLTMKDCMFYQCAKSITLIKALSLVTADLEISFADHKLNLLGGLPNLTSLRLYATIRHTLGLLNKSVENCPILNNLKSLELGELETSYDWNFVACILQHSPNLKKLILNFCHSTEVTAQEALPIKFSIRHEFLEIVEIRFKEENEEMVSEVVTTLGTLVKTIGKIIIL